MNDIPTSSCITPSSMDESDEGSSDYFNGVEKVKVICYRGKDATEDDDGKFGDASLIEKY